MEKKFTMANSFLTLLRAPRTGFDAVCISTFAVEGCADTHAFWKIICIPNALEEGVTSGIDFLLYVLLKNKLKNKLAEKRNLWATFLAKPTSNVQTYISWFFLSIT